MSDHEKVFVKISFWNLLGLHGVEIPIIQRDYAQGRESKESVRERFLDALHGAVTGKAIELDFIYGDLHGDAFQPLDGQQRLTTLFLLHWYAARRAGLDGSVYRQRLSKFSYETRSSSKAFCHGLIMEDFEVDFAPERKVSISIIDCPWYFAAWRSDPTVDGMLRMLDAIHEKFKQVDDLWERLTAGEFGQITFNYIKLESCGLSDDLYIKMNARGKPLTAFENFKALLEKKISTEKWDSERALADHFSIKVDTVWTDAFWELIKPDDSGERHIDRPFWNFFKQIAACSIANGEQPYKLKEYRILGLLNETDDLAPRHFDESGYADLYTALDLVSKERFCAKPSTELRFWGLVYDLDTILLEVIQGIGPIYKKRVLLQAQIRFFAHNGEVGTAYHNWMRVVRNIVQQATIDSPETFIGAIRLINELSRGIHKIYAYLSHEKIESTFAGEQVKEEVRKAQIIEKYPEQTALIHELEDLAYCQGRIGFALYCVNEDADVIDLDFDQLVKVCAVIRRDFSMGITTELRRTLFTVSDGRFYKYWGSYLYAVEAPKHCAIEDSDEFRNFAYKYPGYRHYLKELVLKLSRVESVVDVIRNFRPKETTPNWIRRLVEEPGLMEHSAKGFFAVKYDDSVCHLIQSTRVENSDKGRGKLKEVK
ncbi:MAG: hypothetical protein CML13_04930 [Puniceicoccaceae bacterium]|nr:hypothetical protein [Puniceicoccaceae bacterium]|tara:strand:+ start:1948 stop:3909 length:1962 start_codon:yes stop_codon:yes gene_type:complete